MKARLQRNVVKTVTVSAALVAQTIFADDYVWLASPASASWNESDANWSGAGSVWVNGAANHAIFGDSSEKKIAADAVTLGNLTFTADGYTIAGGPLLMYGGFSVGAGLTAVMNATVTNNVGICEKTGTGTLVLDSGNNQTNLFSTLRVSDGLVHITGGTHEIYTNSSATIYSGFDIRGGSMVVSGGKVRMTSGGYSDVKGSLLITNGVVDLSASREFLNAFNGPGVTTVSDNGVLNVKQLRISQYSANSASQNALNINTGGTVWVSNFYIDTNAYPKGTVNFNGGTLMVKASTDNFLGTGVSQWLTGIHANVLAGGAVIDTGANIISIKQPLVSGAVSDGGLTKRGGGILSLLSTNCYNGPTVVEGGLLTFNPQANTQTLFNVLTCVTPDCSVAKGGNGTLVFDPGATAVNTFGSLWCSNGTMVVASGTNYVTQYCNVQNGPGLRVSGGTLLVAGGVLMTTTSQYVNVDGGHLLVTNGVVNTLSCSEILNGISSTYGFTTVGGSGVLLAKRIRVSQNSTPASNNVVTVNAGGLLSLEQFNIDINYGMQKGLVVLNGGTVQARMSTADFLGTTATLVGNNNDKWLTNIFVHVQEGGAVFDTDGKNISIKQPLYSDAAVDGGLIKRGAGTLTLLNTNTYNGVTVAEGGTLKFGRDELLPTGNVARAAAGGVLDVNGKTQALAGIGGGGVITNLSALTVTDTIEPGDPETFGTLTLSGLPASMEGCALVVNASTNGACGSLHVNGDLDLAMLSLEVQDPGQLAQFKKYEVASCTGTLSGPFASVGTLPARWIVKYDAAEKTAYLVYDFGTLISVR